MNASTRAKLLMKKLKKDKGLNMPHITNEKKDDEHQIDVLYLPSDKGFKYLLVITDVYDRYTYALPLKNKTSAYVLNKLLKLYDTHKVPIPRQIDIDLGSEFKGVFRTTMKDKNIAIKVAQPGRHRQQAIVERKNQQIGDKLFEYMLADEIRTNKVSKQWLKYLPKVLDDINKKAKHKSLPDRVVCDKDSCNLLNIGQKVLVMLDNPQTYHGKKLTGRFRSADIRWNPNPRTIMDIILIPGKPPMYYVNKEGSDEVLRVGYTKNQLQSI